ncbi:chaperone NapD [Natranaerofaba carboxydovora]|uniref:chaperone NapD n=1 Tax=Natranaerofaba carboxydovora TaxID=2742683 RepID=UPI001F12EBAA|nr:chaperone NapD [Natranaerofaba carboxydovora]UMZ73771.1 NapD protein [Natranaerofaba carboxydovora]
MIFAGALVKLKEGFEKEVEDKINELSGAQVEGKKEGEIAVVLEAPNTNGLESLSKEIENSNANIHGVFPVYINFEELAFGEEQNVKR